MPPYFCPATALLGCDNIILRWPGPFSSGFLSPQPPGVVGIGPVRRIVYPHTGPTKVGPFSFSGDDFFSATNFYALISGAPQRSSSSFRDTPLRRGLRCATAHHSSRKRAPRND